MSTAVSSDTRVDGTVKVSGAAKYTADVPMAGLVHGAVVTATIPRGRIVRVDAAAVDALLVLTHENAPQLNRSDAAPSQLLQGPEVEYRGQIVALVVAETLERARAGAEALVIEYETEPHEVVLTADATETADKDTDAGDVETALEAADVSVDAWYTTPAEHNNPMEPHSALAHWDGDRLTVHDTTQGVNASARTLAGVFGLPAGAVRVITEHLGGGFGSKIGGQAPAVLAAMAARRLERPVRVVLRRQQLFALPGAYRTPTIQRVRLGAGRDGRLVALDHLAYNQTSRSTTFDEEVTGVSRVMYAAPNLRTRQRVVALDVPTPGYMRAPGKAPGAFALESAMDELAEACGVDPVELRIRNEPEVEPGSGLPFSSRGTAACLREGAERFGWAARDPRPAATRDGRWLIGTGVALSCYGQYNSPSSASATAHPDGSFTVRIAAVDLGTGARTVVHRIATEELGTHLVTVEIGDTDFGSASIAGGSMGTASWSFAVASACRKLRAELPDGPPAEERTVTANTRQALAEVPNLARHSFGAQFAEVRVDIETGEVRVSRLLGIFAAGRIVSPRTARSQMIGGMTMGLSMALHEESVLDVAYGGYLNHDLAGYHIASHADVPAIEADWIDEVDERVNPMGIKGLGEVGIVGTAAAIANAVWHATGVRQRDLPIRPDRVLLRT